MAAAHSKSVVEARPAVGAFMKNIMSSFRAERSLGQDEKFSHIWDVATHVDQTLVEWCHCKAALGASMSGHKVFEAGALHKPDP